MTTAPRKLPSSTSFFSDWLIFASFCEDMPTSSGLASGSGCAPRLQAANARMNAARTGNAGLILIMGDSSSGDYVTPENRLRLAGFGGQRFLARLAQAPVGDAWQVDAEDQDQQQGEDLEGIDFSHGDVLPVPPSAREIDDQQDHKKAPGR